MVVVVFYNLSGFLVTLAGVVLGLLATLLTGFLSLGVVVASGTWIAGGLWWRMKGPALADGRKSAWPSVFFVPMPILGAIFLLVGGALAVIVDVVGRVHETDPRRQQLRTDERQLRRGGMAGDKGAAGAVELMVLGAEYSVKPKDAMAFVGVKDDAVLIIVKIPNLSEFRDADLVKVLDTAEATIGTFKDLAAKKKYVGVKGALIFGACRAPGGITKIGPGVTGPLLDYYGPPQSGTGNAGG